MKLRSLILFLCLLPAIGTMAQTPEFWYNGAADVIFRYPLRGSGGRALVHDDGNILTLNYGDDFTGGTKLGSNFLASSDGSIRLGGVAKSHLVSMGQIDQYTSSKNMVNFSTNNHGSVLISSNLYMQGNDNLKIANSHASASGSAVLLPGNGQPNQGGISLFTNNPGQVTQDQPFARTAAMVIAPSGNVGIGSFSPGEKLSVNGKIRAQEIKVEASNWPDYVFSDDYKLPSLDEVETFVKTSGHLPGVPSAKQVAEEGVELGAVNKILLQKIEELTLYLLEMKKEIKELKANK